MSEKKKPGPKRAGPPTKPIAFRIPPDILDVLDQQAKAQRISRNKLVELILQDGLNKKATPKIKENKEQSSTDSILQSITDLKREMHQRFDQIDNYLEIKQLLDRKD